MRALVAFAALLIGGVGGVAAADEAADRALVRGYLAQRFPGKSWERGPTPLASAVLRKSYPGLRFYYVFSPEPLPPGANLQELQRGYERARAAHQAQRLSLTLSVDDAGQVRPLVSVADLNAGLVRPTSEAQRRSAAAAIASLQHAQFVAPQPMRVDQVELLDEAGERIYNVTAPGQLLVSVQLDRSGRCRAANAAFLGSLPPSAPPSPGSDRPDRPDLPEPAAAVPPAPAAAPSPFARVERCAAQPPPDTTPFDAALSPPLFGTCTERHLRGELPLPAPGTVETVTSEAQFRALYVCMRPSGVDWSRRQLVILHRLGRTNELTRISWSAAAGPHAAVALRGQIPCQGISSAYGPAIRELLVPVGFDVHVLDCPGESHCGGQPIP